MNQPIRGLRSVNGSGGLERKTRIWYASETAVRVPHVLWVPDLDGRQPGIGKWVTGVARKSSLLFWLQVRLTRGQWGNPVQFPLLALFFQPQSLKAIRAVAVRVETVEPKRTLPVCRSCFPREWGTPQPFLPAPPTWPLTEAGAHSQEECSTAA